MPLVTELLRLGGQLPDVVRKDGNVLKDLMQPESSGIRDEAIALAKRCQTGPRFHFRIYACCVQLIHSEGDQARSSCGRITKTCSF